MITSRQTEATYPTEQTMILKKHIICLVAFVALLGCDETGTGPFSAFSDGKSSLDGNANREYYPDDGHLVAGKAQFREGNYGKSYTLFKKSLDVVPNDPAAWLGFAASADMLRRFDKADFAYKKLQPVIGNRIEYHNNRGYSLLLRGDLRGARTHFIRAYEIDPSNERAANNLEMLRNSVNHPKRARGDLKSL